MRVVLDTNIFVSGIHWSGFSEKILRAWFLDKFELVASFEIIDELINTLMAFKIPMKIGDIFWWENLILEKAVIVMPKERVYIVKKDVEDNKFIEVALEGEAEYIVSKDKHLLEIGRYKNIKIITPEEFLKLLERVNEK